MIRLIMLSLIGLSLLFGGIAVAKVCTRGEAAEAETDLDNLKEWESVYRSFNRFSHCDRGVVAEGYSDAVGRLLADDWTQFGNLNKLCSTDEQFRKFVIRHIDETIPVDGLQKIIDNARSRCPSEAGELCKEIDKAASAELESDEE